MTIWAVMKLAGYSRKAETKLWMWVVVDINKIDIGSGIFR